ncbi:MAG: DUF6338 family protein [Acidobacteria bacterium]|nr:DUF6338 family protein [Acidobacteriota bacterium]MCA1642126.1 DUF6338 family protein [Acidobacteriota bacterium]
MGSNEGNVESASDKRNKVMTLSGFLIRIILLVIPGIIGSSLYRNLRGKTSRKDWEGYLEILVFSFIAYGVHALLNKTFGAGDYLIAFRAFTNESAPIDHPVGRAIFFASLLSVPVAFGASYVDEYKLINKFARSINATRRFGDEDVWDYFNRSPDIKWVYVRDQKRDVYYYGWIQAWSDPYKNRELLLREVEVYQKSTAELLYRTDAVYLARKSDDLTIDADLTSNTPVGGQEEGTEEISDDD